ncbi:sortase [Peribacillus cavernae]|uniref:Sortase n=1 Tax=Peribacillus cavernae TaxID=1674310 RepID=A0A433HCI8_9BACI|nr:sortase [Peribacillus cavernae]MDQ0219722.1 sortase (surface protein transpeptidase) [Peribacillus cavernae]RUQ25997.1 sortase [Peribacillus cavernae]
MKQVRSILLAGLVSILLSGCQTLPLENKVSPSETQTKTEQIQVKASKDPIFKEFALSEKEAVSFEKKRMELEREAMKKSKGIVPQTIEIPEIKVTTSIEQVGVLENGQMDVPKDDKKVGWFEPGTLPGEIGSSVFAGHVDNKTGPAVFYKLKDLEAGDEIIVSDKNGNKKVFVVQKKASYPYNDAPIKEIFGNRDSQRLNLITCTGEFNRSRGSHEERLVVYSELREDQQKPEKILDSPKLPSHLAVSGTFLTWHAVRDDTIIGYRVYKKEQDGTFKQVGSISALERKSYTDPKALENEFYVTAVDLYGQESKPSEMTLPPE